MRIAAWALVTLAGVACSRRSLQGDDAGTGPIGRDAAVDAVQSDRDLGGIDALPPTIDASTAPVDGGQPLCGLSTIAGGRVPIEILLVLDRSITGDQTGWRNLISAIVDQINGSGARFDWGLYVFPKDGPACGAATVTAGADLGFGAGSTFHLVAHVAAAGVDGNGTPIAAAIGAGAAYLRTVVDQSPKFMMLVTDGAPTCAGTIGAPLSDDAALAQADAVAAIAAAELEGFPTIVVAPTTTTAAGDVAALNALAQASRYALPGDIKFFTESTLAQLFVPTDSESCTFALPSPPPVPDKVSVTLNGVSVPRDTQHLNGWDYIGATHTGFSLYGTWCSMLVESRSFEIRVTYGCPIFPVP